MHREDVAFVSYSDGFLSPNGDGFTGSGNQLFSDRSADTQPFDVNAADNLNWSLSRTGALRIHYHPWEFETTWEMSCNTGSVITKYVAGFGIVTLTFRELLTPVQ